MISTMQEQMDFGGDINNIHEIKTCINNNNNNSSKNKNSLSANSTYIVQGQSSGEMNNKYIKSDVYEVDAKDDKVIDSQSDIKNTVLYSNNLNMDTKMCDNFNNKDMSAFNKTTTSHRNDLDQSNINMKHKRQENNYCLIENVHNYSKISSKQNSNQINFEKLENNQIDIISNEKDKNNLNINLNKLNKIVEDQEDDKNMPDHHARRPMNAFLIFCKRHRAIVREKYKQLENRSVTKILGDWWATLSTEEKSCYTSLAKQYKDAFFSANPNFKWYKLPAPPLRTLTTRPNYADHNFPEWDDENPSINIIDDQYNSQSNTPKQSNNQKNLFTNDNIRDSSNVTMFKFADETQMGNLNSLMTFKQENSKKSFNMANNRFNMKSLNFDERTTVLENMQITPEEIDIETKAFNKMKKSENLKDNCKKLNIEIVLNEEKDVQPPSKSMRACKGKKYQEFINSGQIQTLIKKTKSKQQISNKIFPHNIYCKSHEVPFIKNEYFNNDLNEKDNFIYKNNNLNQIKLNDLEGSSKQFDASDFELDNKIKALPAQCFENYLSRKRETKKKKKISKKRQNNTFKKKNFANIKNFSTNEIPQFQKILEARERFQNAMVGSQKRKARKESITRRDVNFSLIDTQSDITENILQINNTITTNQIQIEQDDHLEKNNAELLILAEVAANHIDSDINDISSF